jgi:diadenosine tetraphosphate (Ap4A) HIT family hydrolase
MCGLVDAYPDDVKVLAKNRHAIAVLSRYQLRRGHVLVLARRHVEQWTDVGWHEWREVQRLAFEASQAIERAFDPVRVYSATLGSNGKVAPTSFPHLHVHVVPIYESDERGKPSNVFTWKHGLSKPTESESRKLQRELVAAWKRTR